MKPNDFSEFREVLQPVAEAFNEPCTVDRVKFYFVALVPYEISVVRSAILLTANQPGRAFFPKPGEIIATIEGDHETRAMVAWTRFSQAIRNVGPDSPVAFNDPAMHATIEALGGWREVNIFDRFTIEEQGYRGIQFRTLYQNFLAHPDPRAPVVLNPEALAWTPNALRRIDARGLPEALPTKALPPPTDSFLPPEQVKQALSGLVEAVGAAMNRRVEDSTRIRSARALGPGDKPLDVEPTEDEQAEHERRRQIALEQIKKLEAK